MIIEGKWTATNNTGHYIGSDSLENIAGKWGTGVDVNIIRPYTYSRGPINISSIPENTP